MLHCIARVQYLYDTKLKYANQTNANIYRYCVMRVTVLSNRRATGANQFSLAALFNLPTYATAIGNDFIRLVKLVYNQAIDNSSSSSSYYE